MWIESSGSAEDSTYGLSQVSFLLRSGLSSGTDIANFETVLLIWNLARKQNLSASRGMLAFSAGGEGPGGMLHCTCLPEPSAC